MLKRSMLFWVIITLPNILFSQEYSKFHFKNINDNQINYIDSILYKRVDGMDLRLLFKYNTNGHLDTVLSEWFINGAWDIEFIDLFEYSENGNLISQEMSINSNGELFPWKKTEFRYTVSDKLESELNSQWGGDSWSIIDKYLYRCDSFNKIIEKDQQFLLDDTVNYTTGIRTEYSYDEHENIIYELVKQRAPSGELTNSSSITYKYDLAGNVIEKILQSWSEDWKNSARYLYQYTEGNLVEETQESWVDTSWNYLLRTKYTFDGNNKIKKEAFYYNSNNWVANGEENYDTDQEGKLNIESKYDYGDSVNYANTNLFIFGPSNKSYRIYGAIFNFYTSVITDINENKFIDDFLQLSQNYPNPFNPQTTISFSLQKATYLQIKIYNSLGEEIETLINHRYKPGQYKVEFDGTSYTSGVYFYRLVTDYAIVTKKMILLK